MDIQTTFEGDRAIVVLSGHLDTNTAPDLGAELDGILEKTTDLVLDLSGLDYLSSAGLRVLVATLKKVTAAQGSMIIKNVCDDVREVFEMTGLIDVFTVE